LKGDAVIHRADGAVADERLAHAQGDAARDGDGEDLPHFERAERGEGELNVDEHGAEGDVPSFEIV